MSVGLGDLGLGDLSRCNGDSQRSMDIWRRKEGLIFWVENDWLEGCRRGLAVCVIHHGVALGVVIPGCSIHGLQRGVFVEAQVVVWLRKGHCGTQRRKRDVIQVIVLVVGAH